ncbi:MAG: hypothetical protein NXI24_08500 [bacterium]|nr:hypothetical protein [bacterium]
MPQNPHVRTIRLFNPAQDLAVDDADPRRVRKRRPPVNPAEGLLNDDDDADSESASASAGSAPAPASSSEADYTRVEPKSSPAPQESKSPARSGSAAASAGGEQFESSVLGEVPDIIEGDFPEPVDL